MTTGTTDDKATALPRSRRLPCPRTPQTMKGLAGACRWARYLRTGIRQPRLFDRAERRGDAATDGG